MAIDNLARPYAELERLIRRVERLERAAPLGFSSISRGALRILSEEGLIVEGSARISGVLAVTGTENVTGTLNVSGTENVTGALGVTGTTTLAGPLIVNGTANITGPNTTVTGPFHVAGDQDNTGKLAIKGVTTLENDLQVKSGGKITVEGAQQITLQSVSGTATLQFSDGPRVWSNGAAARMDAGPGTGIVLATDTAGILRSPNTANAVATSDAGTLVTGPLTASSTTVNLTGVQMKAGAANNLHIDADGRIWRTS